MQLRASVAYSERGATILFEGLEVRADQSNSISRAWEALMSAANSWCKPEIRKAAFSTAWNWRREKIYGPPDFSLYLKAAWARARTTYGPTPPRPTALQTDSSDLHRTRYLHVVLGR